MKKYILIASLALAGFTASCELDRFPGSSIATGEAFKSIKDAEAFRNGNYDLYRTANFNSRRMHSDLQVDIVNAAADFANRGGLFYLWQEGLASDYDIRDFYSSSYSAISNINNFLGNIDNIVPADAAEAAKINNYKGEAYLMRASLFHNLVRFFAKAYNPATADTDLGIAIPLEFDPNAKPARATLKGTYDQIQIDLDNAKTLLTAEGAAGSIWLTKDFAHAIQARVSLERQDWAAAISATEIIIPKYKLGTTKEDLEALWQDDTSSEIVVGLFTSRTEGRSGSLSYLTFVTGIDKFQPDFLPTKKVIDAYAAGDFRKDVFLKKDTAYIAATDFPNVMMINKYPGNEEFNTTPGISNYVNKPKLFMISEAYLIKAEAQARGGAGDAIGTLNILSAARGGAALSGDALKLVKEERFREMLAEGQRFLDLKRWNEGLNRTGGQASLADGGLFNGNGATTLQKPATDKMWVWEIPLNDLRTNENLVPNWK